MDSDVGTAGFSLVCNEKDDRYGWLFLYFFYQQQQLIIQDLLAVIIKFNLLVSQPRRFLNGRIMAGQGRKRRKLCRAVRYRHAGMRCGNMVGQMNDVVIAIWSIRLSLHGYLLYNYAL